MLNFKWLIAILIATSLCTSCRVVLQKKYDFTSSAIPFGTGRISATLNGTAEAISKDVSAIGRPYKLSLWFTIEDVESPTGCNIALTFIIFKNLETNKIISVSEANRVIPFRRTSDGAYRSFTIYRNIDLKHSSHELSFLYTLDGNCGQVKSQGTMTMEFKKEYSEENITFWDVLMGI